MMRNIFAHSLRRKLIILLTAVASVSVLAACVGLCTYQLLHARGALYNESYTLAQLVSDNSSAALLFNDSTAANETLAGLNGDNRVALACLYSKDGDIVGVFQPAKIGARSCPEIARTRSEYTFRHLYLRREVKAKSDVIGLLYMEISLQEMYLLLLHFTQVTGLAVLCASIFALLLSSFTEKWISGPILHLTQIALTVSRTGDYDVRANHTSEDEVGLLVDQFNVMLDRIRQRELELRGSYDVLEAKVQERTQDLTLEIAERKLIETDLERARITAEESNRAKSTFLANMSHELRTPLNAIIGYSEMLAEDAETDGHSELESDLKKILSSARHLLGVISDVLDFSKIEAGQMKVHLEPVSIHGILQDIVPTAEILATQKNNAFHLSAPKDAFVQVDALRFRQCLLNLVSNACKFTNAGSITLSVFSEVRDEKNYIVWSVRDTGVGIAPENCDKLFKSFSQVDNSATRHHGGTGLGLVISQQLSRAMGGWIEVTSELGVGSTFQILLPYAENCDRQYIESVQPFEMTHVNPVASS